MIKKQTYIFLVLLFVLIFVSGCDTISPNSGKNSLKEDYEVSEFICSDSSAIVEMKSLGNRKEQILDGLVYLYQDCPNSKEYVITILQTTKECNYVFNGELVKIWYENIGEDNKSKISEEGRKIVEDDTRFYLWKSEAQRSYEFELKYGTSKMTYSQQWLSAGYKSYLENGITPTTFTSYLNYEINNPYSCE